MIGRRLAILSASAALHLGGAGLVLLAAGVGAGSAILIDLVSDLAGDARPVSRADTAPRPVSAPAERTPGARPLHATRVMGPDPAAARSAPRAAPVTDDPRPAEPAPASGPRDASASAMPTPPSVTAAPLPPAPGGVAQEGAERGEDGEEPATGRPMSTHGIAASTAGAGRPGPGPAKGSAGVTGLADAGSPVALAAAGEGRGGLPPEYALYLQRFRRRVAESMRYRYPLAARRQGLAGTVELEVLLEPSGRVAEVRVIASSSHAVLDEAALDAVKRLSAEPFPERLPRRPLRIHLPLAFELE